MSFSNVFIGNTANDGTGDALRTAFDIINQNFANLAAINNGANVIVYASGNANVIATYNPGVESVAGRTGNITLTINDVIGAASIGYVNAMQANTALVAANLAANLSTASVDANVAAANLAINSLRSNITAANVGIAVLQSNAAAQAVLINAVNANVAAANAAVSATNSSVNTLVANASVQSQLIAVVNANIAAANAAIAAIGNVAALNSNIQAANVAIAALQSNAGTQAGFINTLNANVGAANASAQSNFNLVNANVIAANLVIASLQSNSATQAVEINSLRANITAANVEVAGLRANAGTQADLILTVNANIAAANAAIISLQSNAGSQQTSIVNLLNNAAVQTQEINSLRANITAANSAIASVDTVSINANVTAANAAISALQSNAGSQSTEINSLRANITASNVEVTSLRANAGVQGSLIQTLQSNAAVQADLINTINANVAAANVLIVNLQSNAAAQADSIVSLFANASSQGASMVSLTANAAFQSIQIDLLNANVIAANANAASQTIEINSLRANITASNVEVVSLRANAGVQAANIISINSNVAAANVQILNLYSNAAVQATTLANLTANAGSQAVTLINLGANVGVVYNLIALGNTVLANTANVQVDTVFNGNVSADYLLATNKIETETFIRVGPAHDEGETWANAGALFFGNTSGQPNKYYQINLQNVDSEGSGDLVITADDGNDFSNFINVGINNSQYSDINYPGSLPNDGYLYMQGGNLYVLSANNDVTIGNIGSNVTITQNGFLHLTSANLKFKDNSIQTTAYNAAVISANIGVIYNLITLGNSELANLNINAATQDSSINSLNANVGAFQTYANLTFGVSGYNDANVTAYLGVFDGNIVPSANVTYDLGSSTRRWRDLYLSGNTINLGNTAISSNPSNGITVQTVTMGNITFTNTGLEGFGSYAFGNVRLTSDGFVIGSGNDPSTWIYLQTDYSSPNPKPEFYMGGSKIGIDDNGNFVFGTPVAGANETVDDVYQIIDIVYKGGANLVLDPNVSISSQVYWLDKLAWRYGIAQDLSSELTALGNPWNVYTPYNGGSPTNPIPVLTNAYENGSLQFVYNEADKVYTYTAAQANIAVGNIMVTTTFVETSPNVYVNSTDPNDWFEVNWAPVFAKGKTAANVNFNSSNVSVWNSIGVADVPANVTAAIDSLASVIVADANVATSSFTMSNVAHWTANVSTIGAALDQIAARIWAIENP